MENRIKLAKDFANSIKSSFIEKIVLFGSVARGEDNKNSDIDILVIADNTDKIEDNIYDKAFNIYLNKDELLSVIVLSQEDYEYNKNTRFIDTVEKEGILIG